VIAVAVASAAPEQQALLSLKPATRCKITLRL
jgi:hypothetical protein